ncbi:MULTISPECIES: UDP-N-acetylmuramoyl-L-alanyl-D-glutamate--2,6-diaminopimelate ligase [unclassified Bosea (in: a-proteobacteria)]|uniref:UDP-N-acetylmuramoyl-L-alanyl-D-glutamate--2, 6-diaminopimelate ligase n=1 Tax=unclassified Bosea (in: a-proteobacteria) TaxID=2653178 RepID=UPI000F760A25|nr:MULTISPECIES: UDP-N-acetylmuramoyl-L-alanyl-D-glutamate--2,6-diaminopimelate ligase [unclassified Bosea (in: a-proteobacteria)]AZO76383.1 UDP-N-acetylmuramoyl-L-alanyl-D-glutamate--2,6-diaminopimelate ligase [Bosea sp. Tri-49]RXT26310.1 UDP-N-acetylmuramoyl-L-alanyl-D-glutamate--2,6-diaminopimelate ligase [Bosea sp. Tri-39]RXT31551.1 UDP-N-acetylmuramoyl-L-alanyl-D-glutamate--2,6-diaminopimelate ligase [Bosea sp. Tri-54]
MTQSGFSLGQLFPGAFPESGERRVNGLAFDSRKVSAGDAFVALAGAKADGARFIADAVQRGAVAIVAGGPRPADLPAEVAYAQVEDPRRALALAAATVHPRQPGTVVAVTGTSGKSSVAEFTRQIFMALGRKAASVGTIGIVTEDGADYGSLTTPDPLSLHASLDKLAGDGVTHVAMEASSHGLDQRRLDGVRLSAGAFLNLGRDHLDYHPSVEDYLSAKLRLWELLPAGAPVVINRDEPYAADAEAAARAGGHPVIGIGKLGDRLKLLDLAREGFSQRLTVEVDGATVEVVLPIVGDYMAGNALVAAGLAIATGEDPVASVQAIAGLKGVPGRLDRVAEHNGGLIVVDYAHKPDALAAVLKALRPYAGGRLVCVFGCGGDRDRGKRPLMGKIAADGADIAIVTDDNPRSEDPAAIRAEVLAAAPDRLREIGDRAEAIAAGVTMLQPGDVLVVAGKGHESGQIVGDRTLPFLDHDVVREAIVALAGGRRG